MVQETESKRYLNVLLVEDSNIQVQILEFAIQDLPIIRLLHVCRDGEEGIAYLTRQGEFSDATLPDVILCDINMPKMDGFELLNLVKADETLHNIPFVMLTTSETEKDIARAYQDGANSYISKPIDIHGLEKILYHFAHYWEAAKYSDEVRSGILAEPEQLFGSTDKKDLNIPPKSLNVLLVEDSKTQAEMIRCIFDEFPEFNLLDTIEDGEGALAFLQRTTPYEDAERPVLVLLDLILPEKDGIEVLREMRADANLKDIVVVVLTDNDHAESIVDCYNSGANTFLNKPITSEGMWAILHRFAGYWTDEAIKLPPG